MLLWRVQDGAGDGCGLCKWEREEEGVCEKVKVGCFPTLVTDLVVEVVVVRRLPCRCVPD